MRRAQVLQRFIHRAATRASAALRPAATLSPADSSHEPEVTRRNLRSFADSLRRRRSGCSAIQTPRVYMYDNRSLRALRPARRNLYF